MTSQLPTRVSLSPDALFQALDDEMVILHRASERYYGLDETAALLWQSLAEDADLERAIVQVLAEYDVDGATFRADLVSFLEALESAGLVVVEPAQSE